MSPELVPRAQSGFANALDYDTYRPSYPQESVSNLLGALKVLGVPGARILDLAAGTGKLTEQLVARAEGYDILAVDPHPQMLEVLVHKRLPGVRAITGTASNMAEVDNGWANAVLVAQAFHWFANTESLREIHRVLKPGGGLGLVWNLEDYNSGTSWKSSTVWEDKLKDIIRSRDVHDTRSGHKQWQDLFENQARSPTGTITEPLFSVPVSNSILPWTLWLSKDAFWNRYKTLSQIAVIDADGQEEMRQKVFDIMSVDDVESNDKGEIALHGRTEIFWTFKI